MTVSAPPLPGSGPRPQPTWSLGRVLATTGAVLLLLLGTGLLIGGAALRVVDGPVRDDQGYLMGSTERWESPGYAVQSDSVDLRADSTVVDLPRRLLGTMRATAGAATADGVFVGVARTADVDRYLRGVAHSTMVDPAGHHRGHMMSMTTYVDGGRPLVDPREASFWTASAAGTGEQTITWEPENGSWTLVVMSRDGTSPVVADVAVGAEVPIVGTAGTVLVIAGGVLVLVAAVGLWLALRRP